MFLEVITTITSKVEITDDEVGLKVVSHALSLDPGDLPEEFAYAIALGGAHAAVTALDTRLHGVAEAETDIDEEDES